MTDTETKECIQCEAGCTTGCLRTTDCRNCSDQLCDSCETWDECTQCIGTADLQDDGTCECKEDTTYSFDSKKCGDCEDFCNVCETGTLDCQECENGFYINNDL